MTHCIEPNTGQEAVWDHPRPLRLQLSSRHVRADCLVQADDRSYFEFKSRNDLQVGSQEGDFCKDRVNSEIVSPFKGGPGIWGW